MQLFGDRGFEVLSTSPGPGHCFQAASSIRVSDSGPILVCPLGTWTASTGLGYPDSVLLLRRHGYFGNSARVLDAVANRRKDTDVSGRSFVAAKKL